MSTGVWTKQQAEEWIKKHRAEERIGYEVVLCHTGSVGWRPYVRAEDLLAAMADELPPDPGRKIPDWRPGAIFWRPLEDGREITVYPLLFGKARLCVGPLADPIGYDDSYVYPSIGRAVSAAEHWNPELESAPSDYESRRGGIVMDPDA